MSFLISPRSKCFDIACRADERRERIKAELASLFGAFIDLLVTDLEHEGDDLHDREPIEMTLTCMKDGWDAKLFLDTSVEVSL